MKVTANRTTEPAGRVVVLTLSPEAEATVPPNHSAEAACDSASDSISINRALVVAIARRRARLWGVLGPLVLGAFVLAGLLAVPQRYEATVSLALQQPTGGAAALLGGLGGNLLGGSANGGPKMYLGVLKSRAFAEDAARAGNVVGLYDLTDSRDAADLVQDSLAVEDRKDGLLYLHISLSGPARLAPGAARKRRAQVKNAAARIANRYPEMLRAYLEKSDVDRDAVLLRTSAGKVERARQDYDDAVTALTTFVRKGGGAAGAGADTLQTLYLSRGQMEADIRAGEAAQAATKNLVGASDPAALASLPGEDPLLSEARQAVRAAQTELDRLRVDLADTHPDVVQARARLHLASQQLARQAGALRSGQTTSGVNLAALRARRALVVRQIGAAESALHAAVSQSADRDVLRDRVGLQLETLKELSAQAAVLGLQSVSGKNRLSVVDAAQTPRFGRPGLLFFAAAGLLSTLLLLAGALAAEYVLHVARAARIVRRGPPLVLIQHASERRAKES